MCAMIPMFRYRSSGYSRFTADPFWGFTSTVISPLVVAEGLVGLRHLVRLFFAADRGAGVVHGDHELARELLPHRLARALARRLDEPAHRERAAPVGADLDGDLVGRATDAARLHLNKRRGVLQRGLEDLEARLAGRSLGAGHGVVDDALGLRLLAVLHELVRELLDGHRAELAVGVLLPVGRARAAWHLGGLLLGLGVLRAVERAALLAVLHAAGVEGAADDVVLHGREVAHRAAADEDDRVLLEVMADPRDVRRDLHAVRETDTGDLAECRVRLLRGHGADDRADAPLLGRALREDRVAALQGVPRPAKGRRVHLLTLGLPTLPDQLRGRRHGSLLLLPLCTRQDTDLWSRVSDISTRFRDASRSFGP